MSKRPPGWKKKKRPTVQGVLDRESLDGRSSLAKGFDQVKAAMIEAMGGDVNIMEEVLLERTIFKVWQAVKLEERWLTGEKIDSYTNLYLSWTNSIRQDFVTLGIKGKKQQDGLAAAFKKAKEL